MTQGTEVKLEQVAKQAMSELQKFFRKKEATTKDVGVARVATSVLSAWTRQQQTKSASDTTKFMVARELASDKEQLAEYIRLTMPDFPLVKALTATSCFKINPIILFSL